MSADHKIDYLELPAQDLDAIQVFYEAVFGWTFVNYGPEYRAFSDGRMNGGFYLADAQSTTDRGAALIVLFSSNLEDSKARILACGGRVIKDIFPFPGGRRFQFGDPNGNELAVWAE